MHRKSEAEKLISYHRTILHDPATFPNPSIFNPDRFLDACITKTNDSSNPTAVGTVINSFLACDPLSVTFGYGRRVCPGRYMADAQIWISIACILAVFEIGCGEFDGKGRGVKPEGKFTSGLIRYVVILSLHGYSSGLNPNTMRIGTLCRTSILSNLEENMRRLWWNKRRITTLEFLLFDGFSSSPSWSSNVSNNSGAHCIYYLRYFYILNLQFSMECTHALRHQPGIVQNLSR